MQRFNRRDRSERARGLAQSRTLRDLLGIPPMERALSPRCWGGGCFPGASCFDFSKNKIACQTGRRDGARCPVTPCPAA
jgi:hypothetical protein